MLSKLTIQIEQEQDADPAGIAYSDGGYFILREVSEYVGREYCYVYLRRGDTPIRLSGPLEGLMPGIALIERIKKENAAKAA